MSLKPQKGKLTGRRVRRNYTEEFRRDAFGMIEREFEDGGSLSSSGRECELIAEVA